MPASRDVEALQLRARWLLASVLSIGWLLTASAPAAALSTPDRPAGAAAEVPQLPSELPVAPPNPPPVPDAPEPPPVPDPPPPPSKPSTPTPPDAPAAGAPDAAPAGGGRPAGGESDGDKAPGVPHLPVEVPRSAGDATGAARSATGDATGAGASPRDGGAGHSTPSGAAPAASKRGLQQSSVEAAEPAPLRRLLAWVWPAFAVAPADAVVALLEGRLGAAIERFPAAAELLRQVAPQVALASTRARDGGRPAGADLSGGRPTTDSLTGWITNENRLPLLVAVALCGALTLLLVAAIRRDLRAMSRYRWRH